MRRIIPLLFFLILLSLSCFAVDFIPQGDISGVSIRKIYNFTNVSANKFCDNSGRCANFSELNSTSSYDDTLLRNSIISNSTSDRAYTDSQVASIGNASSNFTRGLFNVSDGNMTYNSSTGVFGVVMTSIRDWLYSFMYSESEVDNLLALKLNNSDQRYNDTEYVDSRVSSINNLTLTSNLTVHNLSATFVNGNQSWSHQSYPAACPSGAITHLGDSVICTDEWVDISGDVMTGSLSLVNLNSSGSVIISNGNLSGRDMNIGWGNITNYPLACSPGTAVTQIGDSLVCTSVSSASYNLSGEGLVLYYSFDEDFGSVAFDSAKRTFNGVIYNATRTNGMFGRALLFNNSGYVLVNTSSNLSFYNNSLSVSLWFKLVEPQQDKAITEKWESGSVTPSAYPWAMRLLFSSDKQQLTFGIFNGTSNCNPSSGFQFSVNSSSYNQTSWHHVVGVVDKNASSTNIYVDGVLRDSDVDSCIASSILDYGRDIVIGARNIQGTTRTINGTVDEFRVYNRSLSSSEVYTLFMLGRPDQTPTGHLLPYSGAVSNLNLGTNNLSVAFINLSGDSRNSWPVGQDVATNLSSINSTFALNDSILAKKIEGVNASVLSNFDTMALNDSKIAQDLSVLNSTSLSRIVSINSTFALNDSKIAKDITSLNGSMVYNIKIINDSLLVVNESLASQVVLINNSLRALNMTLIRNDSLLAESILAINGSLLLQWSSLNNSINTLNITLIANDSVIAKSISAINGSLSSQLSYLNNSIKTINTTFGGSISALNSTFIANDSIIAKNVNAINGSLNLKYNVSGGTINGNVTVNANLTVSQGMTIGGEYRTTWPTGQDVATNLSSLNSTFIANDSKIASKIDTLNSSMIPYSGADKNISIGAHYIQFDKIGNLSLPPCDSLRLYVNNDSDSDAMKIYVKDCNGIDTDLTSGTGGALTLPDLNDVGDANYSEPNTLVGTGSGMVFRLLEHNETVGSGNNTHEAIDSFFQNVTNHFTDLSSNISSLNDTFDDYVPYSGASRNLSLQDKYVNASALCIKGECAVSWKNATNLNNLSSLADVAVISHSVGHVYQDNGDEMILAQLSYSNISGIGVYLPSDYDAHKDNLSNPHNVTPGQIGAVDISASETIGGLKTFSQIPILPSDNPTLDNEAVRKAYVDALFQSQEPRAACTVATTANISLEGIQVIDGVNLTNSYRVLVKNQDNASLNGIYNSGSGAWNRSSDYDSSSEVQEGTFMPVINGTLNSNKLYIQLTKDPVINESSLVFSQLSAPTVYFEGDGIDIESYFVNVTVYDNGALYFNNKKLAWKYNASIFKCASDLNCTIAPSAVTGAMIAAGTIADSDIGTTGIFSANKVNVSAIRWTGSGISLLDDVNSSSCSGSVNSNVLTCNASSGQWVNLPLNLSSRVPYSGASGSVDLGSNNLSAQSVIASDTVFAGGRIRFDNDSTVYISPYNRFSSGTDLEIAAGDSNDTLFEDVAGDLRLRAGSPENAAGYGGNINISAGNAGEAGSVYIYAGDGAAKGSLNFYGGSNFYGNVSSDTDVCIVGGNCLSNVTGGSSNVQNLSDLGDVEDATCGVANLDKMLACNGTVWTPVVSTGIPVGYTNYTTKDVVFIADAAGAACLDLKTHLNPVSSNEAECKPNTNQVSFRSIVDLSGADSVRLYVAQGTTAPVAGSKLVLQYADRSLGCSNWYNISNNASAIALLNASTNVNVSTEFSGVVSGAKKDVCLRIAGFGGNGVQDPTFRKVSAEFKMATPVSNFWKRDGTVVSTYYTDDSVSANGFAFGNASHYIYSGVFDLTGLGLGEYRTIKTVSGDALGNRTVIENSLIVLGDVENYDGEYNYSRLTLADKESLASVELTYNHTSDYLGINKVIHLTDGADICIDSGNCLSSVSGGSSADVVKNITTLNTTLIANDSRLAKDIAALNGSILSSVALLNGSINTLNGTVHWDKTSNSVYTKVANASVGIGTTTPDMLFEVEFNDGNNATAMASLKNGIKITNTNGSARSIVPIIFGHPSPGGDIAYFYSRIYGNNDDEFVWGGMGGAIDTMRLEQGKSGDRFEKILTVGNIEDNTTLPSGADLANYAGISVVSNGADAGVGVVNKNLTAGVQMWIDQADTAYIDSRKNNSLHFRTSTNISATTAMTIKGNGDIGLRTTSPTSVLQVNGNVSINNTVDVNNGRMKLGNGEIYWNSSTSSLIIRVT